MKLLLDFALILIFVSYFQGFNATVFAYGATGSGKTYTMVGQPNNPGCMARALNELFGTMDDDKNKSETIFKVRLLHQNVKRWWRHLFGQFLK